MTAISSGLGKAMTVVLRTHPLGCACPRCNPASVKQGDPAAAKSSSSGASRHTPAAAAGGSPEAVYKIPRHQQVPANAAAEDPGHSTSSEAEPAPAPQVEMPAEAPPPLPSAPRLDVRA